MEIGVEESSGRMRISRYEAGMHEPPVATAKLIASAFGVPLSYLYCEDDDVAALLLALHKQTPEVRREVSRRVTEELT